MQKENQENPGRRAFVYLESAVAKRFKHALINEPLMEDAGGGGPNNLFRIDKSFIGSFRSSLHSERKKSADPDLEHFLIDCFADDLLVEAYYNSLEVERMDVPLTAPDRLVTFKQWQEAQLASRLGAAAASLSRDERRIAAAAAFVYGAGIFYLAHPYVRVERKIVDICAAEARAMNCLLLEDALRRLRSRNTSLGEFVTAIFDPLRGPEDPEAKASLRRVREALDIVTHRIEKIWIRRIFS